MVQCPECTSQILWKDGTRQSRYGDVQRYLCRDCGYRFSHPPLKENSRQKISRPSSIDSTCRIGAKPKAHGLVKNLAKVEPLKEGPAGATEKATEAEIKGKIVEHAWYLKKEGYRDSTIRVRATYLKILAKRGANLFNPESVKETIARQQSWCENTKLTVVSIYDTFLKMLGLGWNPPKYRVNEKLPFIPLESEIDQLISSANKRLATFLQLLKETAMRAGEAWSIRWIDIDFANNMIRLNTPEKHSNPRVFKVSNKLLAMLNQLPKRNEKIFNGILKHFSATYLKLRKRLAHKLNNPRFIEIHFHTLRHWKATMEYYKTKDILHVKNLLGHKKIDNTMKYTQLVNFETNNYTSRVANSVKEARELVEAGFDYVCDVDDHKIFRKRK